MRTVLTSILVVFLASIKLKAQHSEKWEIVSVDSSFKVKNSFWSDSVKFGGISAISRLSDGNFMLVSDRAWPSSEDKFQDSWCYISDSSGNIHSDYRFFAVKNVESLQLDSTSRKIWYSFEEFERTGIGFIDSLGNPNTLVSFPLDSLGLTADNKGVEALSVSKDLWFAFEASSDSSTIFVKWPELNAKNQQVYSYPMENEGCMITRRNGMKSSGNGVSEILSLPNQKDKLLVLERCFNGKVNIIKLFETDFSSLPIRKKLVFSWSPDKIFDGKILKPDNMEGMAWGANENGKKVIYLVSDDNHNPKYQRTILVKLRER